MNTRRNKILGLGLSLVLMLWGVVVLTPALAKSTSASTATASTATASTAASTATASRSTSAPTDPAQAKYPLVFDMDIKADLDPKFGHTYPGAQGQLDPAYEAMWKNISITVTDSKGNVYESPKAFINYEKKSNPNVITRYGGEHAEGEELTITVKTSDILDGFHLSYEEKYTYVSNTSYNTFKVKYTKGNHPYMGVRIAFGRMDVKFDPQGGSINGSQTPIVKAVNKDNTVDFPAAPTKEGLHFKRWYTQLPLLLDGQPYPNGLGGRFFYWNAKSRFSDYNRDWQAWNDPTIDPMYDCVFLLRAQYEAEVSFDTQGGNAVQPVRVIEGKTLDKIMPAAPTKPNAQFKEWNTKTDGTGTSFTADTPVNKNITVYAIYTQNMVPIQDIVPTLALKDATITQGDPFELTSLIVSATDKKDGNLLAKVQLVSDGGFDATKPGTYTVTFKVTNSVGASVTKKASVTVTEKPVVPTPDPGSTPTPPTPPAPDPGSTPTPPTPDPGSTPTPPTPPAPTPATPTPKPTPSIARAIKPSLAGEQRLTKSNKPQQNLPKTFDASLALPHVVLLGMSGTALVAWANKKRFDR